MARHKNDGKGQNGGGIKKGEHHKVTTQLRELIQKFADDNMSEAVTAWKEIEDPKAKVDLYFKIIRFVLPTLTSVDLNTNKKPEDYQSELSRLAEETGITTEVNE